MQRCQVAFEFRPALILAHRCGALLAPAPRRQPVEVLGRAAHLPLPHQFDQVRSRQLGDVVVGVAEGNLQLAAELAGGEDPAAVKAENFEGRDPQGMSGGRGQPLPVNRDRISHRPWSGGSVGVTILLCNDVIFEGVRGVMGGGAVLSCHGSPLPNNVDSTHELWVSYPLRMLLGRKIPWFGRSLAAAGLLCLLFLAVGAARAAADT